MIQTKDQTIDYAKENLEKIYLKYKESGILAVYLWGTVTRSDFDPKTSDIDVICVVSDDFPLELNEQIKNELSSTASEREWGFQIIYLDELNGGEVRSHLAKAISPKTITPFFDQWLHLYGQKFSRDDFSIDDASLDERMRENIFEIHVRTSKLKDDTPERKIRDRKGIVKACLFLIYSRQQKRHGEFDMDYNILPSKADGDEKPLLEKLFYIRNNEVYDEKFDDYIKSIELFADNVDNELA